MRILNAMGAAGAVLFLIGGSIEAEPGADFEWIPYVLMCAGLLLGLAYTIVREVFYFGDE